MTARTSSQFYMTGKQEQRFRAAKDIPVGKQQHCHGECGSKRSITQFADGDDVCMICRRRMPKVGK